MPPKKDLKAKTCFKQAAAVNSVIPATVKNPARDPRPQKVPEQIPAKESVPQFEPYAEFEDFEEPPKMGEGRLAEDTWPGDYRNEGQFAVFWRRPREFMRKEYPIEDPECPPRLLPSKPRASLADQIFLKEDTYSTYIESEMKREYMQKQIDAELCVCEIYEREETEDECERRKKDFLDRQAALAKEKKKPGKGQPQETLDENPQKVSDVRLNDVCVFQDMPEDGKWIASQLQMIKDRDIRDVNTGKPLWTKIYPQNATGAPQLSERYVVKLYHMGKEKKVEIDDRFPVNHKN